MDEEPQPRIVTGRISLSPATFEFGGTSIASAGGRGLVDLFGTSNLHQVQILSMSPLVIDDASLDYAAEVGKAVSSAIPQILTHTLAVAHPDNVRLCARLLDLAEAARDRKSNPVAVAVANELSGRMDSLPKNQLGAIALALAFAVRHWHAREQEIGR